MYRLVIARPREVIINVASERTVPSLGSNHHRSLESYRRPDISKNKSFAIRLTKAANLRSFELPLLRRNANEYVRLEVPTAWSVKMGVF
jgi:hypothetical protein